jgi:hypothetical protein
LQVGGTIVQWLPAVDAVVGEGGDQAHRLRSVRPEICGVLGVQVGELVFNRALLALLVG